TSLVAARSPPPNGSASRLRRTHPSTSSTATSVRPIQAPPSMTHQRTVMLCSAGLCECSTFCPARSVAGRTEPPDIVWVIPPGGRSKPCQAVVSPRAVRPTGALGGGGGSGRARTHRRRAHRQERPLAHRCPASGRPPLPHRRVRLPAT